jgi:hypothetical protein
MPRRDKRRAGSAYVHILHQPAYRGHGSLNAATGQITMIVDFDVKTDPNTDQILAHAVVTTDVGLAAHHAPARRWTRQRRRRSVHLPQFFR